MNKIIVYEKPNFQGLSKEYTNHVLNLVEKGFDNRISSVKVIGGPWLAYEHPNYGGSFQAFEEGVYPTVEHDNAISSLERVWEDLTNPQITLYEHPDYQGNEHVVKHETSLVSGSFNDIASSHKVQRGVWVLYEHPNKTGQRILARSSEDVPDYGNFHDKLSCLVPLKPGKTDISAEVLWDRKKEHSHSAAIEPLCSVNPESKDRPFRTLKSKDFDVIVTESFSFSDSTQVSWGASFEIDVGKINARSKLPLSSAFTVKRGGSNTRITKNTKRISLPATVPPRTKLTVHVMRKQVSVTVPVRLIISMGSQRKTEEGEYRFQTGEFITTEFEKEEI